MKPILSNGDRSVHAMLSARDMRLMIEWMQLGAVRRPSQRLTIAAIKAFQDGALGSRGARLLADYTDQSGHRGVSGNEYGFDQDRVAEMMRAGFQVAIHAIGDAGNRETIDFIESVIESSASVKAGRHRIEHAQVLHPSDISRFAQLEMIASMQPPHAVEDKTWAEERLGASRVTGAYAWRTLRSAGAELVFSSDLPGSDYDVFYGLNAAVARQDKQSKPQGGWYPDQRMTPEEAVRGYTEWAARTAFVEDETGVLAPGRWADVTVMSIDPFVTGDRDPGRMLDGSILMTIVNGRVVFESSELAPRR